MTRTRDRIDIDFATLPRAGLEAVRDAGKDVLDCQRVLARTGDNVVGEILLGGPPFTEWIHYPQGDVSDPVTHGEYYYHAHAAAQRRGEHGHFHTFLRAAGMPQGVRPAPVPDLVRSDIRGEPMSHLIAISMDEYGMPIRMFTANRWVTGEVWYAGRDVKAMIDRFAVAQARPSWPVNRWIGAMLRLFQPQIVALIDERDAAVEAWRAAHPDRNVLEDRELEVTSAAAIDVERQIAAVRAALSRKR